MSTPTTARNASLQDLAALLSVQQDNKLDAIVPAAKIRSEHGTLVIDGVAPVVPDTVDALLAETESGAATASARFVPTELCDGDLADKLGIPVAYLRRLRAERVDLFDANVNGWLRGGPGPDLGPFPADGRKFLARCFIDPDGGDGVCRAILSDTYKRIDNLDVLTAALSGIREAGVDVEVRSCDLSERRMVVKLVAPALAALAPALLNGYRSPYLHDNQRFGGDLDAGRRAAQAEGLGYAPGGEPIVFAGLVISNSETGGGAFSIVPRFEVQVCRNGLVIARDAVRNVHLGARNDEGVIRWSDETQRRNLELVTSQARDAVTTFLDVDYMTTAIQRIEAQADVTLPKPAENIEVICQRQRFPQAVQDGILDFFIRGGQTTTGGVLNAVTAYAQSVDDPDLSWDLEHNALSVLDTAVAVANGR